MTLDISLQPLSNRDIQKIQKAIREKIFLKRVFTFISIIMVLAVFAFLPFLIFFPSAGLWLTAILVLALLIGLRQALLNMFKKQTEKLRRDLKRREKEVFLGKVAKKWEDSSGYSSSLHLLISGKKYEASFEQWKEINAGDQVIVHRSPIAHFLLDVYSV